MSKPTKLTVTVQLQAIPNHPSSQLFSSLAKETTIVDCLYDLLTKQSPTNLVYDLKITVVVGTDTDPEATNPCIRLYLTSDSGLKILEDSLVDKVRTGFPEILFLSLPLGYPDEDCGWLNNVDVTYERVTHLQ